MGENTKKSITIRLEEDLYKLFKIYCINENKSMQEMVEQLIKKEIKR